MSATSIYPSGIVTFSITLISLFLAVFFATLNPNVMAGSPCQYSKHFDTAWQYNNEETDRELLARLETFLSTHPDSFEHLLQAGYFHLRIGWLYSKNEQQNEHFKRSLSYVERAGKLRPEDYTARLLRVITEAKTISFLPQGDQVQIVNKLVDRIEALIAIEPNDPQNYYVLSWLNFKVGSIPQVKKFFASVLYGGLPERLTVEKGIDYMKKAISLRPDYSVYYFDLGMYYKKTGRPEEARKLFQQASSIPPDTPEELVYQKRAEKELKKLDV